MTSSVTRQQDLYINMLGGFRKLMVHILKRKNKIFDYSKHQVVPIFSLSTSIEMCDLPRSFHRAIGTSPGNTGNCLDFHRFEW